ncbi:hypothetical protein FSP39_000169 [Pinctada imbricata]|uniref:Purple acid phosphatase n=1 Tax=Pinctada imbricata TaxID=66713 RepID=A0AA88Y1J0_PINIB|nr:hypothetical protein FSP39_000169 [Pinctada imbricata]
MAEIVRFIFFVVSFVSACHSQQQGLTPEQIHLSYGGDPSSMFVTWSTMNQTANATCLYAPSNTAQQMTATGTTTKFVDGGAEHHFQYIHRVKLTGLKPGQLHTYKCGNGQIWGQPYEFKAIPDSTTWQPHIALFGDMGLVNPQSMPRLLDDMKSNMYDAIFHVGDLAYDLDSDNAKNGDKFMRLIEPISAKLPYMTCPGNHENAYNFSNYKNRFTMPGDEKMERLFYSFDIGPIHVISISTEYFFYVNYGFLQIIHQYEWLEQDLKEATKPENRAKRPWIITMGHRPMYCSNNDNDDCTHHESLVRIGVPFLHYLGLEKLFYSYGVDLMFWAHEHSYERLWPVWNRMVYNGSLAHPYTNPKAPVHITTGSAGCQEKHDFFKNQTESWSAFRSDDYGYTRMKVFNSSHLYLEQVSDDKGGKIIDYLWLIKDKHGPYDATSTKKGKPV